MHSNKLQPAATPPKRDEGENKLMCSQAWKEKWWVAGVGLGRRGCLFQVWGKVVAPHQLQCTPSPTSCLSLINQALRANSYPKVTVPKKC
jgi:hypothetical protein